MSIVSKLLSLHPPHLLYPPSLLTTLHLLLVLIDTSCQLLTVEQDKQASQDFKWKMVSKYPDVFKGIGTLPGTVYLELVDNYTPHQTAVCWIPISLQELVRHEVEKMLNDATVL